MNKVCSQSSKNHVVGRLKGVGPTDGACSRCWTLLVHFCKVARKINGTLTRKLGSARPLLGFYRGLPAHCRWFGDKNAVPSRDSETRVVSGAMKVGPTKSVRSRRWVTLLQFCKAPRGLLGNLMTLWRRDWSLRLFVVVLQGSVDGENDEEVSKLGLFQITHSHNSETPSYVWLNS